MVSKLAKYENALKQLERVDVDASARLSDQLNRLDETSTETERGSLGAEISSQIEAAKEALNVAHRRRISLRLTAQSLLPTASKVQRQTIGNVVDRAIAADAAEYERIKSDVEAMISDAVLNASDKPIGKSRSEAAEQLARSFMTDAHRRTLPKRKIDPRLEKLIEVLAELGPEAHDLSERALGLVRQQGGRQYSLRLDAILLDASSRARLMREADKRRLVIDEALDRLAPHDDPISVEFLAKLKMCAADDPSSAQIVKDAIIHANLIEQSIDATRARQEILRGLRSLGYDVAVQGEDWEEGERIITSHARDANYDVQIAAIPGGKIQTKVRAHMHAGRTRNANLRDLEMEQKWCDDLDSLHERLSKANLEVLVERADPPIEGEVHLVDRKSTETSVIRNPRAKRLD